MIRELKKLTLLYAEDEDSTRANYIRNFKILFDKVYEARDGEEAKEIYEKYRPDVVVLDINMPKIDGLEVAKIIREYDDVTQIIIISAYSDHEKLLTAMELKLVTYIIKPVSREDFKTLFFKIAKEVDFKKRDVVINLSEGFLWDKERHILTKNSEIVKLTKQEIRLIEILTSQKNRIFSSVDIFNLIWEDDIDKEFSEDSIKTLLKNTRKKLPINAISNIYGLGYRFNPKFL